MIFMENGNEDARVFTNGRRQATNDDWILHSIRSIVLYIPLIIIIIYTIRSVVGVISVKMGQWKVKVIIYLCDVKHICQLCQLITTSNIYIAFQSKIDTVNSKETLVNNKIIPLHVR